MIQGLHFNDTFAPVPQITSFRMFLALSAYLDWEIKQGDVETAFLSADIESELWIKVPNWFSDKPDLAAPGFSYRKLLKAVPGIPQGPRLFHKKSRAIFMKYGLVQCKAEYTLYYNAEQQVYLLVWVDDLFLFYPGEAGEHALRLWRNLQAELTLADWHDVDDCLGCDVIRDRPNRTIMLSQAKAVTKLLLKSGVPLDTTPADTPMVPGKALTKADCPGEKDRLAMSEERQWYLVVIASCIYLGSWTRFDISFAISKLCKYMHNPGMEHIVALKRLLRYLVGTRNLALRYSFAAPDSRSKMGVYGYFDSSHADCIDTRRSTLAYMFFFAGCLISWNTKLHSFVTTAANHSEYCASAKCGREAKWLHTMLTLLGLDRFVKPVSIFGDNKGALAMIYNPVQSTACKHVELADHYARELQESGITSHTYVRSQDNLADFLTKPLGRVLFERFRSTCMSFVD
jgi:hypothetical protein